MALNFTSDIMTLFASKVGNDANYESPGNFELPASGGGEAPVDHAIITVPGVYTTQPTATADTGSATFSVRMKLLAGTTLAAAGTGYTPLDVLTLSGGTHTTTARVNVVTVKLVSAAIALGGGGTGYGNTQTFDVTVAGGNSTVAATVNVTTSVGGVVTIVNSVSLAGSYTGLPTLLGNLATGDNGSAHGTGLALNLVFGINTISLNRAGVYSAIPSNPISTTGGTGSGGTLTGSWGVNSLVVTNGAEYTVTPTISFSGGAAAATAVLATTGSSTSQADEQKLLMLVEIIRSLLAEVNNTTQMKDIHTVIRQMLSAMRTGAPTTFTAATTATNALNAAMGYIAKNPGRTSIAN